VTRERWEEIKRLFHDYIRCAHSYNSHTIGSDITLDLTGAPRMAFNLQRKEES